MNALLEGTRRYEANLRRWYEDRFAALAGGQSPHTLFLGCADSRIDPSLVTASSPGDLFIVRNIANLAPPLTEPELATGVVAAVNFAVDVLGIRDIVVCGHSSCGGICAALDGGGADPHIARWLTPVEESIAAWRANGPMDASFSEVDQLSQWSARVQLDHLRTYPAVRRALDEGRVRLHAFWFRIADGRMLAYCEREGRYRAATEVLGESAVRAA